MILNKKEQLTDLLKVYDDILENKQAVNDIGSAIANASEVLSIIFIKDVTQKMAMEFNIDKHFQASKGDVVVIEDVNDYGHFKLKYKNFWVSKNWAELINE